MILQDKIEIDITGRNKTYYINKGYSCKHGDKIMVKNEDLNKNSHIEETRICDECGCKIIKTHQCFERSFNIHGKDLCNHCSSKEAISKRQETCLEQYGVDSIAKLSTTKEKRQKTCLEIYGVDNPMKNKEISTKSLQTKIDKYGEDCFSEFWTKANETHKEKTGYYISNDPEVLSKKRETCLENFGVTMSLLNPEIKQKAVNTCVERYGVENPMHNKDVQKKWSDALYQHGGIKTSSQQYKIYEMLKEYYPNLTVELNMPFNTYFLDVCIKDLKIDIEYNGNHWHKNKKDKDELRYKELMDEGYRVIVFLSDRKVPTLQQILECIENGKQFNLIEL